MPLVQVGFRSTIAMAVNYNLSSPLLSDYSLSLLDSVKGFENCYC
jgi:hypothetical protein